MQTPLLVVLAGLPGTGKTTLARRLTRKQTACYLRVDVVETVLTNTGVRVDTHGYAVAQALAVSNLMLGTDVVVDAVNAVPTARQMWREAAMQGGARLVVVETVLPDSDEHRRRVERREPDIPGHRLPTWQDVQAVKWMPWDVGRDGPRIVVDTSEHDAAWTQLLSALA